MERLFPVSTELLQDSDFDMEEFLRNEFARRIALVTDDAQIRKYLYGDGGAMPRGVLRASS